MNVTAKNKTRTVDDYIAQQPEPSRATLEHVRAAIRRAVPTAEESISYNIPTYKIDGHPVIYFAGWKKHFSLYPATADIVEKLKDQLAGYEVEKGTIRFPLSRPAPVKLIAAFARLRSAEVRAGLTK